MSIEQFMVGWPFLAWATLVVFLAGGLWFSVWQLRRDFKDLKPLLEKIPPLEVRVDNAEGEIQRLRDRADAGQPSPFHASHAGD